MLGIDGFNGNERERMRGPFPPPKRRHSRLNHNILCDYRKYDTISRLTGWNHSSNIYSLYGHLVSLRADKHQRKEDQFSRPLHT